MENAAKAGPTDVHLELGGKSAMLVFDDVEDVAATVDWACVGIFSNSGQVCRQAGGGSGVSCFIDLVLDVYGRVTSTVLGSAQVEAEVRVCGCSRICRSWESCRPTLPFRPGPLDLTLAVLS